MELWLYEWVEGEWRRVLRLVVLWLGVGRRMLSLLGSSLARRSLLCNVFWVLGGLGILSNRLRVQGKLWVGKLIGGEIAKVDGLVAVWWWCVGGGWGGDLSDGGESGGGKRLWGRKGWTFRGGSLVRVAGVVVAEHETCKHGGDLRQLLLNRRHGRCGVCLVEIEALGKTLHLRWQVRQNAGRGGVL